MTPRDFKLREEECNNHVFARKKIDILQSLSVPKDAYHDESPKGSIDEEIIDLISELKNTYHMENSEMNRGNVAFQARESNSKYKNSKSQAYAQQNPDNGCPKKEYQQIKCTYCHKTNHIRKDGRK